jgi:exonuclease VII large subunit
VLDRGFALVRARDGNLVKRATGVSPGDALEITFTDGPVQVTATGERPVQAKPKPATKPPGGQGSLF